MRTACRGGPRTKLGYQGRRSTGTAGVCRAPATRKGAAIMVKLVVAGVVVAFLVFYISTSPDQAANIFHSSWHSAVNVAHGIGNFVDKLTS